MRISAKRLCEGETMPRGWGLAYWEEATRYAVILPIPLNVIVRGLREVWILFVGGVFPGHTEQLISRAWQRGYEEAMDFHFAEGYRLGERAAERRILPVIDNYLGELTKWLNIAPKE